MVIVAFIKRSGGRELSYQKKQFVRSCKTKIRLFSGKKVKDSFYLGEISPEAENVIDRNFHADHPNEKWLTDITEFALPEGKLYLSTTIDCFDGSVVNWTVLLRFVVSQWFFRCC